MTSAHEGGVTTPPPRFRSRFGARIAAGLGLAPGRTVLVVGSDEALIADLRAVVGPEGRLEVVVLDGPAPAAPEEPGLAPVLVHGVPDPAQLPFPFERFDGAVWTQPFGAWAEGRVTAALREVYRVLRTKSRIVLVQATVPKNPFVRLLVRPWQALGGVRWTSRDLHGLLELASFWECGLLCRTGADGIALMQGEKFSVSDAPDEIWTESQIVRALRVVGGTGAQRGGGSTSGQG